MDAYERGMDPYDGDVVVGDTSPVPLTAWCEPHNRWERDCPKCGTTDVPADHTCEEA